jgi:type VI secretion system protein ImpK
MSAQPVAENAAAEGRRPDNLALQFQELLTAIVRLRSARKAPVRADTLRNQVRHALKAAEAGAANAGYTLEDARLAVFAVVAFLDESILNLKDPIFDEWVRKPLQEELFGRHTAGEIFFQNLEKLLARRESHDLADLLEVHLLCLLLGFGGRYTLSSKGELRAIRDALADRIARIRKYSGELSPRWRPPADMVAAAANPWTRRLAIAAAGASAGWVLLFIFYKISIGSGIAAMAQAAGA